MNNLIILIKLLSDSLLGSGEGFGAVIDKDIVFDEIGLPYIPAKRIKGCLRDSADQVLCMLNSCGVVVTELNQAGEKSILSLMFGRAGDENPAPVRFANLVLKDYENIRQSLQRFSKDFPEIVSKNSILDTFTYLRQQTSIDSDTGTAKEHTLRTIRALKKGQEFCGTISWESINSGKDTAFQMLLDFACRNLRHIGTSRNRGFGEVQCRLLNGDTKINFLSRMEVACTA